ncbi:MAG: molybdate transporter substrate-binding protein [Verrucomicrobiota bacterium]|jgi:molybdate transport system substrate-binding protein
MFTFRLLLLLALAGVRAAAADLNIYAAASLSDALKEIARSYAATSGDRLRLNLGASSTLAFQIREGAPADIFFSADEARLTELAERGLLVNDTRRSILSNTLVIVVHAANGPRIARPADLAGSNVRRLALAQPDTVPAGIYAKAWLQKRGLWEIVRDRVIPAENVRACLAIIEAGNADAGIVYQTDAVLSQKVRIACEIPRTEGPLISYPLAVLKGSRHPEAARHFAAHLAGPAAQAIFLKYGFLPAP